jgi:hypothetical protein
MKSNVKTSLLLTAFTATIACSPKAKQPEPDNFLANNITTAAAHVRQQTDLIEASGEVLFPKSIDAEGQVRYVPLDDWCSGFYPGIVWYTYDLTGDSTWLPLAEKYTLALDSVKYLQWHHDVGFMIGSSYLNGLRHGADSAAYASVIVEAARSLSTRFRPGAGVIQSWDADRGWQAERGWECPVIIDNMMNLELLFEATRLSGDSSFYKIAVSHADQTLAHHFRPDNSCYHVVDYALADGSVRHRQTAQGYADESAWARGQAWALYGYTMCYRYTADPRYLAQARRVATFLFSNPHMPDDFVPYWDFDAPNIPNEPRDASAAACIASVLYELDGYAPNGGYKMLADSILASLASPAYRAEPGTNGNFILMHSVGSIPHNSEIDVPLNYADYYFLEALIRKRNLENSL